MSVWQNNAMGHEKHRDYLGMENKLENTVEN